MEGPGSIRCFETKPVALLESWDPSVRGALAYNDVFCTYDAVGLRGDVLKRVRAALGG